MNRIIHEKQDMTYLSWSKIRNSSGTAGSFLKAYSMLGGKKTYYKLSNFDQMGGIIGHECVNEIIVDRLLGKPMRFISAPPRISSSGAKASWRWMPIGISSIRRANPLWTSASATAGKSISIRCWWLTS